MDWMMFRLVLALVMCVCAGSGGAQGVAASVDLLPGWRMADGRHVAAIEIRLPRGWKTYWRRPGEAGIPPSFNWSGSRNVADIAVRWPVPEVFHQGAMRSVGYRDGVVLPLVVTPRRPGEPIVLRLETDFGICDDICVPVSAMAQARLAVAGGAGEAQIRQALADRPLTAEEAGARMSCTVALAGDDAILTLRIELPPLGAEDVVIEPPDPDIWISDPRSWREAGTLVSQSHLEAPRDRPLMLDRSRLVTTVIGNGGAVEIRGCAGGG